MKKNHSHVRSLPPHHHKELQLSPAAFLQGESEAFAREEICYGPCGRLRYYWDAILPIGGKSILFSPTIYVRFGQMIYLANGMQVDMTLCQFQSYSLDCFNPSSLHMYHCPEKNMPWVATDARGLRLLK